VHGDYRLGNMIAAGGRTRSPGLEIWSRSDPRMDVAWFITQATRAAIRLLLAASRHAHCETWWTYERELARPSATRWFSGWRGSKWRHHALIVKHIDRRRHLTGPLQMGAGDRALLDDGGKSSGGS